MALTIEDVMFLAKLAEVVAKGGRQAAVKMVKSLKSDEPTMEDIEALADRVLHPSTYFNNKANPETTAGEG